MVSRAPLELACRVWIKAGAVLFFPPAAPHLKLWKNFDAERQ
jgi:hypothetical protein